MSIANLTTMTMLLWLGMSLAASPSAQADEAGDRAAAAIWQRVEQKALEGDNRSQPALKPYTMPPRVNAFLKLLQHQYLDPNGEDPKLGAVNWARLAGYAIGENAHNPALPNYQDPAFLHELEQLFVFEGERSGNIGMGNTLWKLVQEGMAGMHDTEMAADYPNRVSPEAAMEATKAESVGGLECPAANSAARWNMALGQAVCDCVSGYLPDASRQSCIPSGQAQPPRYTGCDWLSGSHVTTKADGSPWCACPDGQVAGGPDGKSCVSQNVFMQAECPKEYSGSQPVWNGQTQKWDCGCPQGADWTADRKGCVTQVVDQTQSAAEWCAERVGPNSWPKFNFDRSEYECICNDGYVFNGRICVWDTAEQGTFGNSGGAPNGSSQGYGGASAGNGRSQNSDQSPPPTVYPIEERRSGRTGSASRQ